MAHAVRPLRVVLACVIWSLAAVAVAAPAEAQSLAQLPGPAGCIVGFTVADCVAQDAIGSPSGIVTVGSQAYVLDTANARISIYDRGADGGLTRRPEGPAGCIADLGSPPTGCADARWLANPRVMTASPDGSTLYVGFAGWGVTVLVRDPSTGALSQSEDLSSCVAISGLGAPCTVVSTLGGQPSAIAVSPDGSDVYVVGQVPANGSSTGYVALLDAVAGGRLAEHAAAAGGCARGLVGLSGCLDARAMANGVGVAVSPDGAHVYVTTYDSESVVGFTRAADGALGLIAGADGCLQHTGIGAEGCRESALLGAEVFPIAFASATRGYVGGSAGAFVTLVNRDPASGGLTTPGSCVASNGNPSCVAVQDLFGLRDLAIAPSGTTLIAGARFGRGMHVFGLLADGSLGHVAPPAGCLATGGIGFVTTCAIPRGFARIFGQDFGPETVALSPGAPFVYGVSPQDAEDGPGIVAARRALFGPICQDGTVDVVAGNAVTLPLRCSDGDDDPIALSVVQAPAGGALGTIDQAAQAVGYTAPASAGTQTLTFKGNANGPAGPVDSAAATVTIRVAARPTPPPPPPPPPPAVGDKDKDGIPDNLDKSDASAGPTIAKTAVAQVVSGDVFIRRPGQSSRSTRQASGTPAGFVALKGAEIIPIGSVVHTTKGRVALTTASSTRTGPSRPTQKSVFYAGIFQIKQRRASKPVTELTLRSANFAKQCPSSASGARAAQSRSKKVVSRLWGNGKGRFRTRGRNSTATVRGTIWLTQERCDGTLTRVTRGSVTVRDLRARKTVIVRAPRSYLARAKRAAVKTRRP